ncbi:hypothetical protein [Halobellus marinus]|uniref:hypothetical protein n=1 Tax=Halobellus TaxID=1073986 RepID=UPI0028AA67A8|nr:hypothetical protein [Halobellus sp. DFY28]
MTRTAAQALLTAVALLTTGTAAVSVVLAGLVFPQWTFSTLGFVGYFAAVGVVVAAGFALAAVDIADAVGRALLP